MSKDTTDFKANTLGAALLKEFADKARVLPFCKEHGLNPHNEITPTAQFTERPKWSDKAARKGRNAAQFIREEFKTELDAGTFSGKILLGHDKLLYEAWKSWMRPERIKCRHEIGNHNDDLFLPTQPRTNLKGIKDYRSYRLAQTRKSVAKLRAERRGLQS